MATRSKLIKDALNNYKNAPVSSWILALTTGVIIAALIAVDIAVPMMSVLFYPLLILPIIFSATLQHTLFTTKGQLTFGSSIKSFGLYFTPIFRGSFRFFMSLLKGLIVFLATEMVLSFILTTILQSTWPGFVDSINQLYAILNAENLTIDGINNLFVINHYALLNYAASVMIPSLSLAILFLIYNNSRYSMTIYYQMSHPRFNPRFTRMVYVDTSRTYRGEMLGDYLVLNWPLFVLIAAGFGGGAVLGYFWERNLMTMISVALLCGAGLAMFFLPFYFANQEALFDKYAPRLDESSKKLTAYMLESLQQNIDLSVEEKKRLEESMLPDDGSQSEENKKDSDEPS